MKARKRIWKQTTEKWVWCEYSWTNSNQCTWYEVSPSQGMIIKSTFHKCHSAWFLTDVQKRFVRAITITNERVTHFIFLLGNQHFLLNRYFSFADFATYSCMEQRTWRTRKPKVRCSSLRRKNKFLSINRFNLYQVKMISIPYTLIQISFQV